MAHEPTPPSPSGPSREISREKLLQYRAGGLAPAEKEEIRRALASDPRLAACCQEEDCLDKCIERCCKQEQPTGDLKDRIRACLAEAAAAQNAAAAAAPAAKILQLPTPNPAAAPGPGTGSAHAAGRSLGRLALVAAAACLLLVGGLYIGADKSATLLVVNTPDTILNPRHPHHHADNPLDSLVAAYELNPAGKMPTENQVISIVNRVGLQRPPHGPNVEKLVSIGAVECPCGTHSQGVKVCFECPGKISWNLSVLCVSPELLAALHEHDCVQSAETKRVYYMCGDKTGKHPCAVFWQEGGKIMVLVAEQPPQNLMAMADGIEF